jgi:ankyrin repeat protein
VERLLAAGADVNAMGCYYNGCTALYATVEGGYVEVVKRLLSTGADVHITSGNKHWTPLQAAMFRGHKEVRELLKKAGAEEVVKL